VKEDEPHISQPGGAATKGGWNHRDTEITEKKRTDVRVKLTPSNIRAKL
jgi:hypothetical protein